MLDLWSSRRTDFVETGSSKWIFSSAVTYVEVVVWFFEKKILLNVRWFLSVNVDFRPLFLFTTVVFPWFVYADITLETVALDTPNNVADFATDAPPIEAPTNVSSFKIWQVSHFPILSHGLSSSTNTNALTPALQIINKRENIFSVANWSSSNVANTNSISQFLGLSTTSFTPCIRRSVVCTKHLWSLNLPEPITSSRTNHYNLIFISLTYHYVLTIEFH
jgi:hypothetical protein